MQRLTIPLDDNLAAAFDALQQERGYASRSEAVRDIVRRTVDAARHDSEAGTHCVANLSYVYDYRVRSLAQRLLELQHAHHDLVVATTHVILDHDSSLETIILRGPTGPVRALADAISAERGVRFGAVNLVIVAPNDAHDEPHSHHHHGHEHATPHRG
ncbi:nickel-responsive regulator [Polymorphobacter glacialis]|uniref:Putative nickel-responsive regulator n=1 Tax=Sandarakinorhabdus glacialis TaxID=1614636 RepID=A0A916ZM01_9SPHN|nr:nickel-responsive transcriptional regulator NikR [Polymorphobacter glacialis]GGE02878.1 nickel-responsive regulator [Polymorphobacter glacialis]